MPTVRGTHPVTLRQIIDAENHIRTAIEQHEAFTELTPTGVLMHVLLALEVDVEVIDG